jgi:hypothetical protein
MINLQKGFNYYMSQRIKYITSFLAFLCFIAIINSGCARTASTKDIILNLEIKVNFKKSIDTDKIAYYFAFSGVGSPKVPSANTGYHEYFPTPGRLFDEVNYEIAGTGVQPLYSQYFSSWSDYIILSEGDVLLYNSEANSFSANTTDETHYSYAYNRNAELKDNINVNTITLIFQIQDLSTAASRIYFTFLTTKKRNAAEDKDAGYIQDVLQITEPSIKIKSGEEIQFTMDIEDSDIDESADIVSWEARIF